MAFFGVYGSVISVSLLLCTNLVAVNHFFMSLKIMTCTVISKNNFFLRKTILDAGDDNKVIKVKYILKDFVGAHLYLHLRSKGK